MKHYFLIDIYKMCDKNYPRMSIVNEDKFGTRLFGGKYNDFYSNKDYEVAITPKMIDEILEALGVDKETRAKVVQQIEKTEAAK